MKKTKKIFISYGHDAFSVVVERLANDLQDLYEKVFFDAYSLQTGFNYDLSIEDAIEKSDIVLYFMSRHSVRGGYDMETGSNDSVCRDEIEFARSCRKIIIPILLENCRPPLLVHRLQFLSALSLFFNGNVVENEYENLKSKLIAVIDEPTNLVQYGKSYSLMQLLNQFDSDVYSKGFTRDFVGRQWLSSFCNDWIDSKNEQLLNIIGDIGTGKSSFVTNLICSDKEDRYAGIYYCRFDIETSLKIKNIVKGITYSVATQLDGLSKYIEGINERLIETASGAELFEKLLVIPLNKLSAEKKQRNVAVIIDAIDEISDAEEKEQLISILTGNIRFLPTWFKIIITSRPDSNLEYYLQNVTTIRINTESDENMRDIKEYIQAFSQTHSLQINDELIESLLKASEGNFLYAHFALNELIESSTALSADFLKYPQGLNGIYARIIRNKFPTLEQYEKVVPLLEILCAIKAPISVSDLADVLKLSKRELLVQLKEVSLFIRNENHIICFYHKSLSEWLKDEFRSNEYFIDDLDGKKRIILWIKGKDNFLESEYCKKFGIRHLLETKEFSHINSLLQEYVSEIAEIISSEILEVIFNGKTDYIISAIKQFCMYPSVISFVVLRRIMAGVINAGMFDCAELLNSIQKEYCNFVVFYYTGQGNILLSHRKNLAQAKECFTTALEIAQDNIAKDESKWNRFQIIVCLGRMGKVAIEYNDLEQAKRYYSDYLQCSIDLYKMLPEIEVLRDIAIGYERLGWIAQEEGDLDSAFDLYKQCLEESHKIYDKNSTIEALRGVAITLERLGHICAIKADWTLAEKNYLENYKLSNKIYNDSRNVDTKRGFANSCHCLGDLYAGIGDFEKARNWFQQDKEIVYEIYSATSMVDDYRDYAISLDRLGFISDKMGDESKAEEFLCKSINIYKEIYDAVPTELVFNGYIIEQMRLFDFYAIHNRNEIANKIYEEVLATYGIQNVSERLFTYVRTRKSLFDDGKLNNYGTYINRRNTK